MAVKGKGAAAKADCGIIERLDRLEKGQARILRGQELLSNGQYRIERAVAVGETSWPWDTLIRRRQFRKACQVKYAVDLWVASGVSLRKACEVAVKDRPSGYKTVAQLYAYCNKPWRRNAFNTYRDQMKMGK